MAGVPIMNESGYPDWMFGSEEEGQYMLEVRRDGSIKRVPVTTKRSGSPPSRPSTGGVEAAKKLRDCNCGKKRHSETTDNLPSRVVRGATGLAKSAMGIGLAPETIRRGRMTMCEGCEHRADTRCDLCGGWLKHKTRLASEQCPAGYWSSVPTET